MKNNSHKKPESFILKPVYPGGKKALDEFIRSELKYPEEAMANKIEGAVTVEHDIDVNGDVIEVRLKHGIGFGCDEEALRVVKLLKYERKRYRGLRVVHHNTINIFFRFTQPPLNQNEQVLNYTFKEKDNSSAEKKITYSITIN